MYTAAATDHFHHPRNAGTLVDADAIGRQGKSGQGPYMVLYLKLDAGRVSEARFQTYGCPAAIACGSWVSEWVVGKTLEEAARLTVNDVEAGLGGLPLGKDHCSRLAAGALQSAVKALA